VSEIIFLPTSPQGFPYTIIFCLTKLVFLGFPPFLYHPFPSFSPSRLPFFKGDTIHPKGLAFPKAMAEEEARLKEESAASVAKADKRDFQRNFNSS